MYYVYVIEMSVNRLLTEFDMTCMSKIIVLNVIYKYKYNGYNINYSNFIETTEIIFK